MPGPPPRPPQAGHRSVGRPRAPGAPWVSGCLPNLRGPVKVSASPPASPSAQVPLLTFLQSHLPWVPGHVTRFPQSRTGQIAWGGKGMPRNRNSALLKRRPETTLLIAKARANKGLQGESPGCLLGHPRVSGADTQGFFGATFKSFMWAVLSSEKCPKA